MPYVASGYHGFDGFKYSSADIDRGKRAVARICRWRKCDVMACEAIWWLDDQRVPNWRRLKANMPQPRSASTPWDNRRRAADTAERKGEGE